MKIVDTTIPSNWNYPVPPLWWRNLMAHKATAIDANEHPDLARDWPGLLLIDGKLAYNETNPESCRLVERLTRDREEKPGPIISVHWPLPDDESPEASNAA